MRAPIAVKCVKLTSLPQPINVRRRYNSTPGGPRGMVPHMLLFRMRGEKQVRYLIAWALGVPGVLIVVWFLMGHH